MEEKQKIKRITSVDITPTYDWLLVKQIEDEDEVTEGGILVPGGALKNKQLSAAVVVKAGPGAIIPSEASLRREMPFKEGDQVMFNSHIGYPIGLGDKGAYILVSAKEVVGLYHEEFERVEVESSGLVNASGQVLPPTEVRH